MSSQFKPGEDRAREAGRRGARAKHSRRSANTVRTVPVEEAPAPPKTLEDAVGWLSWITHSVTTGRIDARTAKEATGALHVFLRGQRELDRGDEQLKKVTKELEALRERLAGRS